VRVRARHGHVGVDGSDIRALRADQCFVDRVAGDSRAERFVRRARPIAERFPFVTV
jgi:hypothetical protein